MQIKKMTQSIFLPIPVADLREAGINTDKIIETCVFDGKILIRNAGDADDFVCDGDCDTCPMSEIDCDENCDDCPCRNMCGEREAN